MTVKRYKPAQRLAEAVVANGLIFTAGQIPENPDQDAKAQVANVLAQIDTILADLGSDKTQIIDATIFLANLDDYAALNAAWDEWITPGNVPARATVEAKLADPSWKVEIKIVAAVK